MTMRFLMVATALAVAGSDLSAQTVTTIVADRDATLYESATGGLANGAGSILFAGLTGQPMKRRTLLHFDVAGSVPAGAAVVSARLELHVISVAVPNTAAAGHRLTQDWSEGPTIAPGGQGSGGTTQNGDVTWLHRDHPNLLWNTAGGDFESQASFSMPLNVGSSVSDPQPGLVGDVQSWLDAPANNFGWIVLGDEAFTGGAAKVNSREASNATEHPRLIVAYLMPGQVTQLGTGCATALGTMDLSLSGTANGGATIPLSYSSAPQSSIGATFFSLGVTPLGVELFPSCSVYLPLGGVLIPGATFTTDASGAAADTFTVPSGFPGFLISCQGAVLDGSAQGFALSNAGLMATQ